MFRWWDPTLLVMTEPYLRRFLFGTVDELRREFELWKWRRRYARLVKTPPQETMHPITKALGPFPSPVVVAPLVTGWSEPAPRRDVLQLSLF